MKLAIILLAASVAAALSVAPAYAGTQPQHPSSTSDGATSVPEPSDAVLLLMGAAGVVVGRRLHARKRRG